LLFGGDEIGRGGVAVGGEGTLNILEELGVGRGEMLLKGFELDDMGEPITKGLRISMLPAGESDDGSNALLRWSRRGFGN
jgi:hypothetical protein